MSVPDNALWAFGTSDFTIDMRVKYTASTDDQMLYAQRTDASNQIQIYHRLSTNTLNFVVGGGAVMALSWSWTETIGSFVHLEIVRSGNNFYAFIDGVSLGLQTNAGSIGNYTGPVYFGIDGDGVGNEFTGVLDEIRISSVARHISGFSPPTQAYGPSKTIDIVSFNDVSGDGSDDVSVIIGSTTSVNGLHFEIAPGKSTLADSWDTRCDPKLKTVISEDETIPDRVYDEAKKVKIKDWSWKEDVWDINTGPMIDDPNIPESIIWRGVDGKPAGFKGTGFISYLYSLALGIIKKTEDVTVHHEQEIAALRTEIEGLKRILIPTPTPTP